MGLYGQPSPAGAFQPPTAAWEEVSLAMASPVATPHFPHQGGFTPTHGQAMQLPSLPVLGSPHPMMAPHVQQSPAAQPPQVSLGQYPSAVWQQQPQQQPQQPQQQQQQQQQVVYVPMLTPDGQVAYVPQVVPLQQVQQQPVAQQQQQSMQHQPSALSGPNLYSFHVGGAAEATPAHTPQQHLQQQQQQQHAVQGQGWQQSTHSASPSVQAGQPFAAQLNQLQPPHSQGQPFVGQPSHAQPSYNQYDQQPHVQASTQPVASQAQAPSQGDGVIKAFNLDVLLS